MKTILSVATAIILLASSFAHAEYWRDSSGEVWRNSSGECWRDIMGIENETNIDDLIACGDAVIEAKTIDFPGLVTFDFDSAELTEREIEGLDQAIETLSRAHTFSVELVAGYADAVGSAEYNGVLGLARALAVAEYFTDRGIVVDLIRSYGENYLAVNTPTALRDNRRVDVIVNYEILIIGGEE